MAQYKDVAVTEANKYVDQLDESLAKYEWLHIVEEKTGIRRAYAVLGVGLFFALFILFGFGASPLCNLIGFVYPLYASFKAVKSVDKDDDSQWLTYWVVYGFFTLVESFTDFFLYWIPLYYFAKVCFLIWCFLPSFKGANIIYKRMVEPLFLKYEDSIEKVKSMTEKQH